MALQSIDAGAGIDSAQVQAACEAAVAAALGDIGTTCEASTSAAIVAECAQFGAIRGVVNPNVLTISAGPQTGATSYTLQALQFNKYLTLHGFTITTDSKTTLQWWTGVEAQLTDEHEVSDRWVVAPSSLQTFRCNLESPLVLRSSNSAAKLRITYHLEVADF